MPQPDMSTNHRTPTQQLVRITQQHVVTLVQDCDPLIIHIKSFSFIANILKLNIFSCCSETVFRNSLTGSIEQ